MKWRSNSHNILLRIMSQINKFKNGLQFLDLIKFHKYLNEIL